MASGTDNDDALHASDSMPAGVRRTGQTCSDPLSLPPTDPPDDIIPHQGVFTLLQVSRTSRHAMPGGQAGRRAGGRAGGQAGGQTDGRTVGRTED